MNSKYPLSIQENVPIAPLTTLKVGGAARFFLEAATEGEICEAIRFAASCDIPVFILGGGSNVLVSDAGFDGLVLKIALTGISQASDDGPRADEGDCRVRVTVQAGEVWDGFVQWCVTRGLAGVECLSGIPGLVGGTPVQNVGAYGQDVSETIASVRCLDRTIGKPVVLTNSECRFTYRSSIFNSTERDRFIVLSVTFTLTPGGSPNLVYKDLREFFDGRTPGLAETREAVLKIRAAKSMVIQPGDPNSLSAGSFFKNPVIARDKLSEIASVLHADMVPHFEAGDGCVKVPAAWLIERAGFHKGFELGNAGISTKHSLALINRGNATAAEILRLKDAIVGAVREKFEIVLLPEPVFVGF